MWSKGNHKGEWEVDDVASVHLEHHLNCDTSEFCCEDLISFRFNNPIDARLVELAPRMAAALLTNAEIILTHGDGDENVFKLLIELRRLKENGE